MIAEHMRTVEGNITLLITEAGILFCFGDYVDTILPGNAHQLGVYLVEKYRPADAPKESGLPLAVELRLSFLDRVLATVRQDNGVMALELGLRWLHDRASRCGCGYIHDTWCTNPILGMRGPLQALELGLRWLHDRADNHRTYWDGRFDGAVDSYYHSLPQALELGLRWLHDRARRCDECGSLQTGFTYYGTMFCHACERD